MRAMDASACKGGTANVDSIYRWLHKRLSADGWQDPVGDSIGMLDVHRNLRNTIHNNGFFYSADGSNKQVVWDGDTYAFENGKRPDFQSWPLHFKMAERLVNLNESMMLSKSISALGHIP